MNDSFNPQYVIHSDEEPRRLERQARLYDLDEDLRFAAVQTGDRVLDAGCGSGYYARAFARSRPGCTVVGLDRDARYLDFARRTGIAEGLSNLSFEQGDVLALPFADASFDLVWSKHLLQWVGRREEALAEFRRVTRPGGRIVASNFDQFTLCHHPVDAQVQADTERWTDAARRSLGFDCNLGRKLPHLFRQLGLQNIRVHVLPDRAFCGFGGDPERQWNWRTQWTAAAPFTAQVFGSEAAAAAVTERFLALVANPDVYMHTSMFQVEGRVPAP